MNSIDSQTIADVAIYVLETMVFASGEVDDQENSQVENDLLLAEVQYTGGKNGGLAVLAPKPICQEWATIMAGDDAADMFADVLGEVANVIGGNLLSRSFPTHSDIKLLPPKVREIDAKYWNEVSNSPNRVCLSVEDSPVILSVTALD